VHGCKQSDKRIFKTKRSHFTGLTYFQEIRRCHVRPTGWCQRRWRGCAEMNRYTGCSGLHLCCPAWDCMWTICWFEIFSHTHTCLRGCMDIGVFPTWSSPTSTCMCSTNLLSFAHAFAHTLQNMFWKNFAGNEKTLDFRIQSCFLLHNLKRLLCTIVDR
jgi:hypothetical protein